MKKSFSNHHEVAHVWASQSQAKGEASHMFFEGPSIYSYGHHFEIARIVKPGVVLFNNRSYSNSTSKHQSRAHSAVTHMKVFTVPSMTDHNANAEYLIQSLDDELLRISRKRIGVDFWLEQYAKQAARALDYTRIFKVRKTLVNKIAAFYKERENPLSSQMRTKLNARVAADRARAKAQAEQRAQALALRKQIAQKDYDAWKTGADVRLDWEMQQLFPTALRVKEDEIQTTRGASVPVIEARKFWHTLKAGEPIAGMRLGHYTVNEIRGTDLIVGCHTIPMREVARMAVKLGLENEATAEQI